MPIAHAHFLYILRINIPLKPIIMNKLYLRSIFATDRKALVIAAGMLIASASGYARDFSEGDFGYNVLTEPSGDTPGTCEVNKYYGNATELTLVPNVKHAGSDYNVTTIAPFFMNNLNPETVMGKITSVTIPEGFTTIRAYTFQNCPNLTTVSLPASLTTIETEALEGSPITSLTVAEGSKTFSSENGSLYNADKTALVRVLYGHEDFVFPATVKSIPANAFVGSRVKSVQWPTAENVEVGLCAFSGTAIESITIPSNLQFPKGGAFANCPKLATVTILDRDAVADSLFKDCPELKTVTFPASLKNIKSFAFAATPLEKIAFPESLQTIGSSAFEGCEKLSEVDFNDKLQSIGTSAFANCAIKNLEIPGSVLTIYSRAFIHNPIETATFNQGLQTIMRNAFTGCAFKSVELPASVVAILDDGFSGCGNLTNFTCNGALNNLGNNIFKDTPLEHLSLSATTVNDGQNGKLKSNIFAGIPTLKKVDFTLAEGEKCNLLNIPAGMFANCAGLSEVNLVEGIEQIGNNAFQNCAIDTLALPESVTMIGKSAFEGNKLMKDANLNKGLTSIGARGFYGCGLEKVVVPATVTTIGEYAFANCPALTEISLGKGVETIGDAAWSGSPVAAVNIDPENPNFVSVDGSLLSHDRKDLLLGNGKVSAYVIPEGVETIGAVAFKNAALKTVTLPASLKQIDHNAFAGAPLDTVIVKAVVPPVVMGYQYISSDASQYQYIANDPFRGTTSVMEYHYFEDPAHMVNGLTYIPINAVLIVPPAGLDAYANAWYADNSLEPGLSDGVWRLFREMAPEGFVGVKGVSQDGAGNGRGPVYDVTGRLVKADATESDLNGLPQGIYIFKGRKVAVK